LTSGILAVCGLPKTILIAEAHPHFVIDMLAMPRIGEGSLILGLPRLLEKGACKARQNSDKPTLAPHRLYEGKSFTCNLRVTVDACVVRYE
jgi:hypothetical protein